VSFRFSSRKKNIIKNPLHSCVWTINAHITHVRLPTTLWTETSATDKGAPDECLYVYTGRRRRRRDNETIRTRCINTRIFERRADILKILLACELSLVSSRIGHCYDAYCVEYSGLSRLKFIIQNYCFYMVLLKIRSTNWQMNYTLWSVRTF